MIGLSSQDKIDLLRQLVVRFPIVTSETLLHVLYNEGCGCGQKSFTYDFCPIAGDPEMMQENNIDATNFVPDLSPYERARQERKHMRENELKASGQIDS